MNLTWNREGNTFYRVSPDRTQGIIVEFKKRKSVQITVWSGDKGHTVLFRNSTGNIPDQESLDKAIVMFGKL